MILGLNALDVVIALGFFTAVTGGYRVGFVARVASWLGMALAIVLTVNFLPALLQSAPNIDASGRLAVVVLLLLSGMLLGQLIGLLAGSRLAAAVPEGPIRSTDQAIGAVIGAAGVLLVLWFTLPLAANVPGWTAQQVRTSQFAEAIYDLTPDPPDTLETLRRLVGADAFPSVFEDLTAAPESGPPPEAVALGSDVIERVKASTVKVEGVACRRTQDGSGFVVAPNLVVTNAHVVAGERSTMVILESGRSYDATVVYFDPARDLALLHVPRFNAPPLSISDPEVGETGAVFGHPGGQSHVEITPAAVRQEIIAVGRDLYERETTRRDVLVLAATLRQGDSGGALVNTSGEVIGVAFAIAPDNPQTAYALNTSELREALAVPRGGAADTGGCLAA